MATGFQTETSTRLTISIKDAVLDKYRAQAKRMQQELEDVVRWRLAGCAEHNAQRPIYFNDRQREDAEKLMGGKVITNSQHFLDEMKNALTMNVGGIEIEVDTRTLRAIENAKSRTETVEEVIRREVTRTLREWAGVQ